MHGIAKEYLSSNSVNSSSKEENIARTLPPSQKKNTKGLARRQAEYIKNQAKWQAAQS